MFLYVGVYRNCGCMRIDNDLCVSPLLLCDQWVNMKHVGCDCEYIVSKEFEL